MGRYVEEQVKLPKELSESAQVQFMRSPAGGWDIIASQYDEKKGRSVYQRYPFYQDGSLGKPETISWVDEISRSNKKGEDGSIQKLLLGEDGNYYVLYDVYWNNGSRVKVFRYDTVKKKKEEIKIPYLEEIDNKEDGYTLYQNFCDMAVLNNGKMVFQDGLSGKMMLYNPENKEMSELPISYDVPAGGYVVNGGFSVRENEIFGIQKDKSGIVIINGDTEAEVQTVKMDIDKAGVRLCKLQNGDMIAADRKGVHRLKKDGSVWESIIDGQLNSMGMPTENISGLLSDEDLIGKNQKKEQTEKTVGEKPQYYILYQSSNGGCSLSVYQFDETVTSVPEKELTVYSLREDQMIRQAVVQFQKNHRDVKVSYTVALDENQKDNEDTTEYIHALNTELLNGNGADILLLAGLPVESYTEKGILADLNSMLAEETKSLLPFITKGYTKEGKLYALPLRFQVSIAAGGKDAVAAGASLKGMADYVRKHEDEKLLQVYNRKAFLKTMVEVSVREWLDEKGQWKEEPFRKFLEDLSVLKENGIFMEKDKEAPHRQGLHGYHTNAFSVKSGKRKLYVDTYYEPSALFVIESLLSDENMKWDVPGGSFYGSSLCAVNAATKEKKLSKEFMGMLLGEDLQKTNLYTGFPVTETALKQWLLEKNPEMDRLTYGTSGEDEDGKMVTIDGSYPSEKIRRELYDKFQELKQPIVCDEALSFMILEAIDGYVDGSKSIDEAARDVKEKINLYLAE